MPRGMALAKAAELNGYPGPLHSLELADKLGLSPEQLRAIKDIKAREEAAARPLGAEIVAAERELDQDFAKHMIDPAKLKDADRQAWGIAGPVAGRPSRGTPRNCIGF
jgi:hypothetical protein